MVVFPLPVSPKMPKIPPEGSQLKGISTRVEALLIPQKLRYSGLIFALRHGKKKLRQIVGRFLRKLFAVKSAEQFGIGKLP